MLHIASSQGLLQSLFCSCLNPLSALTATETPMTKTSDALAQNRTALHSSYSERTARRGKPGQCRLNNGMKREQTGAGVGLFKGHREEAGISTALSSSPLVPGPHHGAYTHLVCAVPGARQGPTLGSWSPRGCIPGCLGRCPCPCSQAPATGHAMHCLTSGEGRLGGEESRTWTWHSRPGVGRAPHMGHSARRCVQPGLQLLACTRTPSAGEQL